MAKKNVNKKEKTTKIKTSKQYTKAVKERERLTHDRREERQRQVFIMSLKGVTWQSIADHFDVDVRTITNDFKIIKEKRKKWLREQVKKFDVEAYWVERITKLRELEEQLWAFMSESDSDRSRLSKELRETQKELDMCLRSAGIKTSDVKPEDAAISTLRIIHEHPNQ